LGHPVYLFVISVVVVIVLLVSDALSAFMNEHHSFASRQLTSLFLWLVFCPVVTIGVTIFQEQLECQRIQQLCCRRTEEIDQNSGENLAR